MKVLVTGTAGFIGSHTALRMLERGDEVVGLDSINDYYDVNIKYSRLEKAGIAKKDAESCTVSRSSKFPGYRFIRIYLENRPAVEDIIAV